MTIVDDARTVSPPDSSPDMLFDHPPGVAEREQWVRGMFEKVSSSLRAMEIDFVLDTEQLVQTAMCRVPPARVIGWRDHFLYDMKHGHHTESSLIAVWVHHEVAAATVCLHLSNDRAAYEQLYRVVHLTV